MSKVVDREGLKAFRERLDEKYVIEGEYSPQTSVGLADNFTPYSEDSGAEQSNPFISNGTGTNNNQEIVTVGDYGLLRSKNGNTVCVNQYARELSSTYWYTNSGSMSISGGVATYTNSSASDSCGIELRRSYNVPTIANHTYLIKAKIKTTNAVGTTGFFSLANVSSSNRFILTSDFVEYSCLLTPTGSLTVVLRLFLLLSNSGTGNIFEIKDFYCIDLTQFFNINVPTDLLNNPSHFSWYYNGSLAYNTGTLVNANGVKLVSTGRNLWDEEWMICLINANTGVITEDETGGYIGFKTPIKVIPNDICHIKFPSNTTLWLFKYDANGNFVGVDTFGAGLQYGKDTNYVIPSDTSYIALYKAKGTYGTTYNHDITISLYYTPQQGGEGYDKYYKYETPYEVDTGSEVLRSAGSVYDYKEPNGTIHRRIGVVDLGTLSWSYSDNNRFNGGIISGIKAPVDNNTVAKIICSRYLPSEFGTASWTSNCIAIRDNGVVYIKDTGYTDPTLFKNSLSGVLLFYELATETIEQGTPFAENLPINDYGMLYWLDENNNLVSVSQGNTIFFPINYKGFLDDMYHRVDGDSGKYVIDTQLQASETERDSVDTQLKNAIGGTLRQLLVAQNSSDFDNIIVVDMGDLNYNYNSQFSCFYVDTTNMNVKVDNSKINGLDTKYKCVKGADFGSSLGKIIAIGTSYLNGTTQAIVIKDTTYTDATQFKNAMKGVLLAYEKA